MKKRVIATMVLTLFLLSISGIASAEVTYENIDVLKEAGDMFGVSDGWTIVWRQGHQDLSDPANPFWVDKIVTQTNCRPWGVQDAVVGAIQRTPWTIELLSINGIPWQIFTSPGVYDTRDDEFWAALGFDNPHTFTIADQIQASMIEHKNNPYSDFRQELPTGSQKMVSIYRDRLVGAYYTSSTVSPYELPGRPYADENGIIMMPLKGIADQLGAEIGWDSSTQTVTVRANSKEIKLKTGSKTIEVNAAAKEMDTAPAIKDGVTFVPMSFFSKQMGYTVKWFGDKEFTVEGNWWEVPRADIYN